MPYAANSDQLMSALLAKLYHTITGDAEELNLKYPSNKYVSWILPGIPFQPEDFDYCEKGVSGGGSAEENRKLMHQAFIMSKLLDFIPDPSGLALEPGIQQTIFTSTQDTISAVYKDVLTYSRVVDLKLSPEEEKKLDEYRAFDAEKAEKYEEYQEKYLKTVTEAKSALFDALSATGNTAEEQKKVFYWSNMGDDLTAKFNAAYHLWETQGYKNDVDRIRGYIDQVTKKSMVIYKETLLDKLRNSTFNSPQEGSYQYTTLVPGAFAHSEGWLKFEFGEHDFHSYSGKSVTKGSLGGGVKLLGLVKIGSISGSQTSVSTNESESASNFKATFEFAQIPILRPWFEPGFFSMHGWDLDKLWELNYPGKQVSDGESVGRLVAYPISALFVRNVTFEFDESSKFSNYFNSETSGGGSAGWGPFRAKGTVNTMSESKPAGHHEENGKITIDGMQLIGFINNLVPKCPDLHPDIKLSDLVGGEVTPGS
ncbi:hypothetical protein BK124_18975 [Paenibacillus amylolyticus]|uniref:hypothetical protein n=1 Tax=Paenibacillus amylolyticus TaxID=1451 RepID=UPI00096D69FF|nr:hypothetical protein [Paenibacillus amylolyticus]OME95788.1 hypothetical protein BK124_18975 [Paenibacillus amylolyticus]